MNSQIKAFTQSLQDIATEYSNPAVILDHIPIVKDHMDTLQPVLDNPMPVLGAGVGLFVLWRIVRKRRKKLVKPTSMVMPPPYKGAPEDMGAVQHDGSRTQRRPARTAGTGEDAIEALAGMVKPSRTRAAAPAPEKRTLDQQFSDISAVSLNARPALSPDEARMRVIVQATLTELGAPLLVMARTALSALIEPGPDAVGPERAHARAAIAGKSVDFALFDRAGRIIVALDVRNPGLASPMAQEEAQITRAVLAQAGIPVVSLDMSDGPAELAVQLAPLIGAHAERPAQHRDRSVRPERTEPTVRTERPKRPVRPVRNLRPAAIPAE